MAIDFDVYAGQYVKIFINYELYFGGLIANITRSLNDESGGNIQTEVSCTGYNGIPARRTVMIDYAAADEYGTDVVTDMVDSYLYQEGIEQGTIDAGSLIENGWETRAINIADVLDTSAERSGYQWFIDKDMQLQFYQDPAVITDADNDIDSSSEDFTDYRNVVVSDDIENYANKSFVLGGDDAYGTPVFVQQGDLAEQNAMQELCAGSGVYGKLTYDSGIDEFTLYEAEASTDTTNIYLEDHPFVTGDYFWNKTRDIYSYITDGESDPDVAVCETVTGQTSGDEIIFTRQANDIAANELKKSPYVPKTIEFDTFDITFEPQTKLYVNLPELGVLASYFNLTEVNMRHVSNSQTEDEGYFMTRVKGVLRKDSNFSTQKNNNFINYFRKK